jgi:hypothetical protein
MTYDEESYILDSITQIKAEVHQNNMMLKDLCHIVNVYLANHHQENEDDFGRNILANLISNMVELNSIGKGRK